MRKRLLLGAPLLLITLGAVAAALALAGLFPRGSSSQSPSATRASSVMAGPGVSFTVSVAESDGLTVTMDGTVDSGDFNIARIVWDWGDGTIEDSWLPARHTYARAGRYQLSFSVYDDHGVTIAAQSSPIKVPN
jgi:PKD repeat protein